MAFCNSCGATLDGGAKFCTKCGATQPGAASAPAAPVYTGAAPAPSQSSGALKIILIVVGVIVVLGILAIGTVSFIGYHIAKHSHVHSEDGNVHVETPFGTMNTSTDPEDAARNLGVDLYPGAKVIKGTTSNMTMGAMHTAAAEFETDDPVSTVGEFYKSRLPNASAISTAGDQYSIISTDKKNMITINIGPKDGKTRIHIARVSGKMVGGGDSDSN